MLLAMLVFMLLLPSGGEDTDSLTAGELERKKLMEENLLPGQTDRILSFKAKAPAAREGHLNNQKVAHLACLWTGVKSPGHHWSCCLLWVV